MHRTGWSGWNVSSARSEKPRRRREEGVARRARRAVGVQARLKGGPVWTIPTTILYRYTTVDVTQGAPGVHSTPLELLVEVIYQGFSSCKPRTEQL